MQTLFNTKTILQVPRLVRHCRLLNWQLFVRVVVVVCLISGQMHAQDHEWTKEEKAVRVAFIFNFARFMYLPDDDSTVEVCVVGKNPFDKYIKSIDGRKAAKKSVKLLLDVTPEATSNCNIVFVSSSAKSSLPALVKISKEHSVLLMSEMSDFLDSGGIVNFKTIGKNTKFEVHMKNLKSSGVRLSSKLLQVAKIVD